MTKKWLVIWGYAIELIAASLALLLLHLTIDTPTLAHFFQATATDFATVFSGAMLAASIGFLWTLYSKSDTDFCQWLEKKGAFSVYLSACMYAFGVSVISAFCLITIKHLQSEWFMWITAFFIILAILNLYTLAKNACDLMRLITHFNSIRDAIDSSKYSRDQNKHS